MELFVDCKQVPDDTCVHVVHGLDERLMPTKADDQDADTDQPARCTEADHNRPDEESDEEIHQSNVGSPTTIFTSDAKANASKFISSP